MWNETKGGPYRGCWQQTRRIVALKVVQLACICGVVAVALDHEEELLHDEIVLCWRHKRSSLYICTPLYTSDFLLLAGLKPEKSEDIWQCDQNVPKSTHDDHILPHTITPSIVNGITQLISLFHQWEAHDNAKQCMRSLPLKVCQCVGILHYGVW